MDIGSEWGNASRIDCSGPRKTRKVELQKKLRGLYVITPELSVTAHSTPTSQSNLSSTPKDLTAMVEQALLGGAGVVQFRDKTANHEMRTNQARRLQTLCRRYGALFIINDDVALASEVGADGVHLGEDDLDLESARAVLGEQVIIGVSCYNRLDLAGHAQDQGADYVAFGRFHTSRNKPHAVQATPQLLRDAASQLAVPIAAIGGITPENGKALVDCGADMLAVIDAVFAQSNVRRAALAFAQSFSQETG